MELLLADCRRAAKSLLRTPGLTVSIVVTLALAIGMNTALFSVVNAVLLAPLPYPEADRLLWVWQELDNRGAPYYPSAPADLVDYARADAIEDIGGVWAYHQPILDEGGPAERVQAAGVTANFFDLVGVQRVVIALGVVRGAAVQHSVELVNSVADWSMLPGVVTCDERSELHEYCYR